MPDETTITEEKPITFESTWYEYYPTTLTDKNTDKTVGLSTDSEAYKMLFRSGPDFESYSYYKLGSSYAEPKEQCAYFGMFIVNSGMVKTLTFWDTLPTYGDLSISDIRAVVALDSNVKLTSNGTNSWTLSK